MKKILILGNSHLVVYKFRKELIEELINSEYDVYVSFPNGPFGEGEETSKKMGCTFIETKINRRGINPIDDLKLIFNYLSIIRKIKPDVVLTYTAKPNIYGGLVCRILNIPLVANITGLGSGLVKKGIVKKFMINLYRVGLKKSLCIFFQNTGDKEFFKNNNIEGKNNKIIPGSGVNINRFIPLKYPKSNEIHFSYIARVMKAKGIEEYLEAAKIIKKKYKNVVFNVAGYCEEDYKDILEKYEKEGIIIYHGLVDDIIKFHKNSHCTVLPTYHPEGISNVLLESAACARPIITTDRIGCRETVINGVSGYLIEEKNVLDLVEKLEQFILLDYEERYIMGIKGRKKIEKEFDRNIIVKEYMSLLKQLEKK